MGKIKEWYRSIPIWATLFAVIVLALLSASVLSGAVTETVNEQYVILQSKYLTITSAEEDGEITYSGVNANEIVEVSFNYENYTEDDWRLYQIYSFILRFFPAFIYSVCILVFALLFYFTKLRTPLHLLTKASNQIAGNDLDFQLDYQGQDEMARLCAAFETMRSALDENNRQMLRLLDERKQLNDAYTHDLRTPIAVLKGYTDMLVKYLPSGNLSLEEVLETVKTMSAQVSRLEQFADSMNTAQKLEDMPIQKEPVDSREFLDYLRESAEILFQGSGMTCEFHASVSAEHLFLDPAVVIQVYENIINNAARFARHKVAIHCGMTENIFSVSVTDDGRGFSARDLREAVKPYYSNDAQKQEYHFGLGLHICRILCEKHGGRLELGNAPAGGASVTASFSTR
ncbi:MAG: HAMP domain-containing histidine kinase [Clostridiales bacterium]|nr:HAMP domain-containing histidine kinase [Clostridiales bacterium]